MRALGLAAGLDQAYKHPNNTLQLEVSFYLKPTFKKGSHVKVWLFSTEMNLLKRSMRSCQHMNLLDLLGAVHKRRWNFLGHFLIPSPPCRNFNPNLPNPYLLISCNIFATSKFETPLPLKYSDVFYG